MLQYMLPNIVKFMTKQLIQCWEIANLMVPHSQDFNIALYGHNCYAYTINRIPTLEWHYKVAADKVTEWHYKIPEWHYKVKKKAPFPHTGTHSFTHYTPTS